MNKLTLVHKKRGPATEEGKRRIGNAHIKTGTRSNKSKQDKSMSRDLIATSKLLLEDAQSKLELWQRMKEGDSEALCEITKQRFGGDPRDYCRGMG